MANPARGILHPLRSPAVIRVQMVSTMASNLPPLIRRVRTHTAPRVLHFSKKRDLISTPQTPPSSCRQRQITPKATITSQLRSTVRVAPSLTPQVVLPTYRKGSYFAADPNHDGREFESLQRHDGVPFRNGHSNQALAPTKPENGKARGRSQMHGLRTSFWGRLLSLISTGEERLEKDLAAVQRGDMKV